MSEYLVHWLEPRCGVWCGAAKRSNSWAASNVPKNVTCPICRKYLDTIEMVVKTCEFVNEGVNKKWPS